MVTRSGSLKVNFTAIAESLGLSRMTVYRVVNNDPSVRRETRALVIDTLNRHGYFTHKPMKNIKIFFDFSEHHYFQYYGHKLMENIARLNYTCMGTDHRKRPNEFFDLAAECEAGVFISAPEDPLFDELHRINPDLYTINLSTKSHTDVTLSPDNSRGSALAAQHFFKNGHRHIAVYMPEKLPTRLERYKAFYAEMKFLDPECRIDILHEKRGEETCSVLRKQLARLSPEPTAIFFLAGEFAENFLNGLLIPEPEKYGKYSVMTFDRPADLRFADLHYHFDRIEFASPDLLDWAEYYITNRPMMKKRSPVHTSIAVHLVTEGSVKNIRKKSLS